MDSIEAKNKTAAFHIYGDLCEVRNYGKIEAKFAKELGYIYFEAQAKLDKPEETEFILPIDEPNQSFNLSLINQFFNHINEKHNKEPKIKKLRLGITSIDFTTIYYDFSMGLDSPFTKEKLSKLK